MRLVASTEAEAWQTQPVFKPIFSWDTLNLNLDPSQVQPESKPIQGFGACFNELGWTSLQQLAEGDREGILRELFDPRRALDSPIAEHQSGPMILRPMLTVTTKLTAITH